MSEAAKKYKATLGKHSEEWTQAEHDNVKKALSPRAFAQYEVSELQTAKPADVEKKSEGQPKD